MTSPMHHLRPIYNQKRGHVIVWKIIVRNIKIWKMSYQNIFTNLCYAYLNRVIGAFGTRRSAFRRRRFENLK